MLIPDPARVLKCTLCGLEVDTRCGGYWFLLLAERGRCRFPGATSLQTVLCSGCGRRLREQFEAMGIGLEVPAYEGNRPARGARVPAGG